MKTSSTTATAATTTKLNAKHSVHLVGQQDPVSQKIDDYDGDEDGDSSSVTTLEISSGDIVVLQDMMTTPELNGKIAKVKHESSNRDGQWLVQLHETGETITVDSENLFMAAFHRD